MNNEDYCDYELSKALKACGFDEPCRAHYTNDYVNDDPEDVSREVKFHYDWTSPYNYNRVIGNTSAPTLWHAQKWLREKKELCVTVYAQPYNGLPYYTGYILFEGDEKEVFDQDGHWFDDYEKCLSETISAALELIKKGE